MKDGIDMATDIAKLIRVPEVLEAINGGVWVYTRPANSETTDIVVNYLAGTNSQQQEGILNINIHTKKLSLVINGKPDNSMPDLATMKKVANLIYPLVDSYYGEHFWSFVEQPGRLLSENNSEWYNIQVRYIHLQLNYQNI